MLLSFACGWGRKIFLRSVSFFMQSWRLAWGRDGRERTKKKIKAAEHCISDNAFEKGKLVWNKQNLDTTIIVCPAIQKDFERLKYLLCADHKALIDLHKSSESFKITKFGWRSKRNPVHSFIEKINKIEDFILKYPQWVQTFAAFFFGFLFGTPIALAIAYWLHLI